MRYTVSIKENRDFRRLYNSGKSAANLYLAIYCRRNRDGISRLGLTVGKRVGKAVVRNRVRRRIREAYRLCEEKISLGFDIIIVARTKSADAAYRDIDKALKSLLRRMDIYKE